jgi:sugar/nucleoside kinase (ribokinase family)
LAKFLQWCLHKGAVTVVDTSTLVSNPQEAIKSRRPVAQYHLLTPVLPEADVFFCSSDEARIIGNTLAAEPNRREADEHNAITHFLDFVSGEFWPGAGRTRLFGVTVRDGAYEKHIGPDGTQTSPAKVESRFMAGDIVDLVGAGDAFRAGLITYIERNLDDFARGSLNFSQALQMGNLFAALYIKAPLGDRHTGIRGYNKMVQVVRNAAVYPTLKTLQDALG